MTELQVMRVCTMRDDENVTRAVAGLSWIRNNSRCFLRTCLNSGVEFMERMSNEKLFQIVGPVKGEGPFSESLSDFSWHTIMIRPILLLLLPKMYYLVLTVDHCNDDEDIHRTVILVAHS